MLRVFIFALGGGDTFPYLQCSHCPLQGKSSFERGHRPRTLEKKKVPWVSADEAGPTRIIPAWRLLALEAKQLYLETACERRRHCGLRTPRMIEWEMNDERPCMKLA